MLLVGSVYSDHIRSKKWYELQIKYLNFTTNDFFHFVYLNGKKNFYKNSYVVCDKSTAPTPQEYHFRGLNAIIEYFKENSQFDYLLLLDSDCFPIRSGWQIKLLKSMNLNNFKVAAAARYENLDTFAHPSIFFIKRSAAINLNLHFGYFEQKNMIGRKFLDTSSNIDKFLPLIRSNKINYHPVLFGVYWNSFYHHGAGSRNLKFRLFYNYFNTDKDVSCMEKEMFKKLCLNPSDFVKNLIDPIKIL